MNRGRSVYGAGLRRCVAAARLLVLTGVVIGVVGITGHTAGLTMLTSAVGPTAYLVVAHPNEVTARLRNAVAGHAFGIGWGLAALAVFGLWGHQPITLQGHATYAQVAASVLAAGMTLASLELVRLHHAPAAATTLLITSGIARPGRPLYGLVLGLLLVLVIAPALTRLPGARIQAAHNDPNDPL